MFVKVLIACCHLARGDWIGMKNKKSSKEKTEELQRGDWHNERFDRE